MKRIVLYIPSQHYILKFDERKVDGVDISQKQLWNYNMPKLLVKVLRRLGPFGAKVVSNIDQDRGKYDTAIFPEAEMTRSLLRYIIKKPIAKRQIVIFSNKVSEKTKYILSESKKNIELYTYNLEDTFIYPIKYQWQCWNKDLIGEKTQKNESDIFFVGEAKRRYEDIIKIKEYCESHGLKTDFTIVSNGKEPFTTSERLPYEKCLEKMRNTLAILDVVGEGNVGLTYRPLEALFLKKKLITNYNAICKYDFYEENSKNIFIMGVDDIKTLPEFIKSPFQESNFDMSKYDIETWIKRLSGC
ncbi:hypothetical protein [Allofournierella massiliensis]|uniref:hypothetical protein n=1 Tax=Allofournierella massiliensis TaxID=1650663 RepID=UPI0024B26AA2|nr:hypothetical protein [Fournierella massiliensis]